MHLVLSGSRASSLYPPAQAQPSSMFLEGESSCLSGSRLPDPPEPFEHSPYEEPLEAVETQARSQPEEAPSLLLSCGGREGSC